MNDVVQLALRLRRDLLVHDDAPVLQVLRAHDVHLDAALRVPGPLGEDGDPHEDEGREKQKVRWDSLAQLEGTVACYVGPKQLPKMLQSLVEHGRSPDEPAAIIIHGTLSTQRTITGTLQELGEQLKEQPIGEAALLIVGKVVNFRDHLRWFDSRALFGKRALVMHSKEHEDEITDLLRRHGANVINDTDANVDVYRLLLDRKIDLVAFTNASAVLNFAANYGADQASDLLSHTVVATHGSAPADALQRAHISPAVQVGEEDSMAAFADAIATYFRSNQESAVSNQ